MRQVIVAANWKMHTTPADAGALAVLIGARTRVDGVIRVLFPPFVCLAAVVTALEGADIAAADGSGVHVGAQNVHHEAAGAYTGEVAAPMLAGLASWVIVGHSERRRDAGETDVLIAAKLARSWTAGLHPILCVGEVLADRESGRAEAVVASQLRGALAGAGVPAGAAGVPAVGAHVPAAGGNVPAAGGNLPAAGGNVAAAGANVPSGGPDGLPWLTVAYEPVWAIGTGRNARGADAAAMAVAIRRVLMDLGLPGAGIPILYGGSVTSANMGEFLAEPEIDGALVGGASLKPDEMAGIVARAGVTAAARAGRS